MVDEILTPIPEIGFNTLSRFYTSRSFAVYVTDSRDKLSIVCVQVLESKVSLDRLW